MTGAIKWIATDGYANNPGNTELIVTSGYGLLVVTITYHIVASDGGSVPFAPSSDLAAAINASNAYAASNPGVTVEVFDNHGNLVYVTETGQPGGGGGADSAGNACQQNAYVQSTTPATYSPLR